MDIPKKVTDKAKDLIDVYGNRIKFIGEYEKKDTYQFKFPQNERTGFPYIYLYDKRTEIVEEITGIKALKIMRCVENCKQ